MAYQGYETDEGIQQIHEEMYAAQENYESKKKGIRGTDPAIKVWFAIFIGGIALFWFLKKINAKTAIILAGIGAIVYFMMSGPPPRQELTMIECMIRIYDALFFLQKHPIGPVGSQIPKGEIRVMPIGRKQWYEGKPFKRGFRVDIYDKEVGLWEMYYVECDIFTGDIITFRHSPEGVRGDETKDIKYIADPRLLMEKRRDEFIGRGRLRRKQ